MSQALRRRTLNTYLVMLFVPVALAGLSFWAAYQHRQSISWVSHTKDVLASLDKVHLSVLGAESIQRGFLLTGNDRYLDNYRRRREEAKQSLAELRRFTSDNRRQQDNCFQLEKAVAARFQRLDYLCNARREKQWTLNSMGNELEEGTRMMSAIRSILSIMTADENRLLSLRAETQSKTEAFVGYSFVLAVLANVALLYWAYQLLKQYSLKRDIAELEHRKLNSELEFRVTQRTAELQAANDDLKRSNEDLTRFAYVASHDLQEPLRTIGSYAGLLARRYEGQLDEQAKKYIQYLVEGAKRMQTLVQDLLAYSKAGTQPLERAPVDLNTTVQQAMVNLAVAISEKQAKIRYGNLPTVSVDGLKMVSVFQNLLGNGLKFSKAEETPCICIECIRSTSEWIISIRDNGIGFEAEYADRIFLVFQRLHSLGTYPGNGIGLAICKRIVEGHGGKIWATSEMNIGSTFFISLPFDVSPAT